MKSTVTETHNGSSNMMQKFLLIIIAFPIPLACKKYRQISFINCSFKITPFIAYNTARLYLIIIPKARKKFITSKYKIYETQLFVCSYPYDFNCACYCFGTNRYD